MKQSGRATVRAGCALVLIVVACGSLARAQILATAHPNRAEQFQTLAVALSGVNTRFAQGTGTTSVRFVQGGSTLHAFNVRVASNTRVDAEVSIPRTTTTGAWNAVVESPAHGTLTLTNGFNIMLGSPANLRVTSTTSTRIDLSWSDHSGTESGFRLERKLGTSGAFQEIAIVGPNVTSFQNTGLLGNTQYCYRVRAFAAGENSAYSNECCGVTNTNAALNAVEPGMGEQNQFLVTNISGQYTNFLQGSGTGVTEVRLTQGNATIRADSIMATSNTSLIASFGLLRNAATGLWSLIVQSTRDGALALANSFNLKLAAPTQLNATAFSSNQIDLSWQDNSDTESGYKIEQRLGLTDVYEEIAVLSADATSFSQIDLEAGTLYCFRVAAFDASDVSEYSNESCAMMATPPVIPMLRAALPDHAEQSQSLAVRISGQHTRFQQGSPSGLVDVRLQRSNNAIVAQNFFAFSDTLLNADFNVPAGAALGAWNVSVATRLDGPLLLSNGFRIDLGSPANLFATAVFSRQVNLRWTDRSNSEDGFRLERKLGAGGVYQTVASLSANVTAHADTGLSPQTDYCYRVAAFRGGVSSNYSDEFCVRTSPEVALTGVAPNRGEQAQTLSVTISGQNTHFRQGSGTLRVWLAQNNSTLDASSFTADNDTQLRANFTFSPNAATGLWNVSVQTSLDGTIVLRNGFTINLAAPTDLTAVALAPAHIALNWRDHSGTESGYHIERKTGLSGTYRQIAATGPTTSAYHDTSVVPSTLYCYRVAAFAGNEVSAYSNESCDTTLAAIFSEVAAGLPGVVEGEAAWGDFDNDGDLDLALTGSTAAFPNYQPFAKIFRNTNGSFAPIDAPLQPVAKSALAWADYDNDGDLDLLLLGDTSAVAPAVPITHLYRNDNGNFQREAFALENVWSGAAAWGDFDNDGDLDLALAGRKSDEQNVAKLYRNTGQGFVDIEAGLLGLAAGAMAWGDYDNDGDLDLALSGDAGGARFFTKIYRNDDGAFVDIDAPLRGVVYGAVAWNDFDLSGNLDLLVHGFDGAGQTAKLYLNVNGSFVDAIGIGIFIPGADGASAWGDYDNDGDADIALTGWNGQRSLSRVYRNDRNDFFEVEAQLPGVATFSSVAWGDFDRDGDLDVLLTGDAGPAAGLIAKIYGNNAVLKNSPPTAPENLSANVNRGSVELSWSPATDAQTPAASLTYNLRLGTTPGGEQIVAAMTGLPQSGNTNHRTRWTIRNLSNGVYYWSVQARDHGFAASAFAVEQTFVVTMSSVADRFALALPAQFELAQNYPNPFNPTTAVRFGLPQAGRVTLKVYDVMGNEIATLIDGENKAAGYHTAVWDGKNRERKPAPSGVYLYVLQAGETRLVRRLVLLR
jgi:hypothetical protein